MLGIGVVGSIEFRTERIAGLVDRSDPRVAMRLVGAVLRGGFDLGGRGRVGRVAPGRVELGCC